MRDDRVREAHRAAVTTALDELKRYSQARIGGNNAYSNQPRLLSEDILSAECCIIRQLLETPQRQFATRANEPRQFLGGFIGVFKL